MLDYSVLNKIDTNILYLPSENSPILSADIGLFIGGNFMWAYDCGASDNAYSILEGLENLNIVISHFHHDHAGNLNRQLFDKRCKMDDMGIACSMCNDCNIFVGRYTYRHYGIGTVISENIYVEDDGLVHIFPLPNSHCKGSLGMEINEKYVFIGDSSYGKRLDKHILYNSQLLLEQYRILCSLKADKCLLSHDAEYIHDKDEVLAKFEKILGKRKPGDPVIIL